MSLFPCPECKAQVSDKAVFCPSCGYPIKELLRKFPDQLQPSEVSEHETTAARLPSRDIELQPLDSGGGQDDEEITEGASLAELKKRAREEREHEKAGARERGKKKAKIEEATPYKGMGPWLRVLCFFLVAKPAFEGMGTLQAIGQGFPGPVEKMAIANGVLALLSLVAGIAISKELLMSKTWGTIKLTALVLWLVWPVYTFIEYLILPQMFLGQLMPGFGQLGSVATVVVGIAGSAFFAFVWTINMLQSPRLAATFSKPEG